MITVFFTVFAMGVGVGIGTVLQKHLVVKAIAKKGEHTFQWNSKVYVTKAK